MHNVVNITVNNTFLLRKIQFKYGEYIYIDVYDYDSTLNVYVYENIKHVICQ